ncbi:MAG: Holliday junction branch migration protein RuvA [Oscillospiraceae bacterium]|jgi:Holliday junction DNA helicase RuvA|nr:Holliday junction branch migration protein RuvA [Oscillospiraceae bacterium]
MLYSLTGTVVHIEEAMLAVDCGGVAFACAASAHTLRGVGGVGERVTLLTHFVVREDAMELYAFTQKAELACFRQLINVTGVGPKAALALLSAFTPEQLAFLVASGDAKGITRAQGVGPKLAQRIALELKDKLQPFSGNAPAAKGGFSPGNAGAEGEALAALLALGYTQAEAVLALRGLEGGLNTQEQIKQALKRLTQN